MKDEPKLIDIFAMLALHAILRNADDGVYRRTCLVRLMTLQKQ